MILTEIAWAAGFFDGEGSTHCCPQTKPNEHLMQFGMTVTQSGKYAESQLKRFQTAVLGCGRVYGPYQRKVANRKPHWAYKTTNFEETQAVIALLWNYLGPQKREQAKQALLKYQEYMKKSAEPIAA